MAKLNEFEAGSRRARRIQLSAPKVTRARYDARLGRIVISLSNRLEISFLASDAQGLEDSTPAQLKAIEISPSGLGLHFPKIDADLYVPAILHGILGSTKWMASRLGAAGGKSKSDAKRNAARQNGRLGGRPRKSPVAA